MRFFHVNESSANTHNKYYIKYNRLARLSALETIILLFGLTNLFSVRIGGLISEMTFLNGARTTSTEIEGSVNFVRDDFDC